VLKQLDIFLGEFSACFSRTAAFYWFVIVIVGFIMRRDVRGVTSMVRCLNLCPKLYETMLCFFRATSWSLEKVQQCWVHVIRKYCSIVTFKEHVILVGDGMKVSKEAKKMPGVKKLHQDSENSGKAEYIYGHHFGFIGLLVGNLKKYFCIPVAAEIHEGIDTIRRFQNSNASAGNDSDKTSVVTRMLLMAKRVALFLSKPCMIIIDSYFATGPAFEVAAACTDKDGNQMLHIITKAKSNTVAYEDPKPHTGKRGRPSVRGKRVVLNDLFTTHANKFQPASLNIYGSKSSVSYLCIDMLWRPIMRKVRFVLVKYGSNKVILMSSNLNLLSSDIIQLYSYRFKIEVVFKELKHRIGSFFYHFWTHAMPKLNRKIPTNLDNVKCSKDQELIAKATRAIEGFVNIGCISIGLLQMLSINFSKNIWNKYTGWLRTKTTDIPTEETVSSVLQQEFYHNFCDYTETAIFKIITAKQRKQTYLYNDDVA